MQKERTVKFFTSRITINVVFWLAYALMYYPFGAGKLYYYPLLLILVVMVFGIPAYFNILFLIPKFLLRKKYGTYALLLALTFFYASTVTYYVFNMLIGQQFIHHLSKLTFCQYIFPSIFPTILLSFGKFMNDAIQYKFENQELLRRESESELEILKSQVNPHFLFNSLNTVYGMSLRSEPQTADTVLKLSNILRHTLYESAHSKIDLNQEISFLQEYISFAQLRLTNQNAITLDIDAKPDTQKISPLLLVPFVENAIKHGLGHDPYAWIKIELKVWENNLLFTCTNTISQALNNEKRPEGGIGLKNVTRRLELLYKDHHEFTILRGDGKYQIVLKLDLL